MRGASALVNPTPSSPASGGTLGRFPKGNDWFYRLARAFLNQTIRLYYRRIEVAGRDHIPSSGPAILVANHPNSSADAFLLASQLTPRKLNFIAKDSLTRAPVLGWIFRQFGLVGVARAVDYERQRDLARRRNQSAIATCVPRLLAGELLTIFGEGISTDARRLHMIRKGAMRFGYSAEQAADFQLGLVWIPVGISYSAKQHFRSDVFIRIGEPFRLTDLDPDPAATGRKLLQRGTERLQRDLESLVLNIEREELAGLIDQVAELLGNPASSLAARVERHQRISRAVHYFNLAEPSRLAELEGALHRYRQKLADQGLSDEVVRMRHPTLTLWVNLLGVLMNGSLMILNLYGWANSLIPRWCAALYRPFGRRPLTWWWTTARRDEERETQKEALYGTYGGWAGAAIAFPLQIYWVSDWMSLRYGAETGIIAGALYGFSLIPSWRLFLRRRDFFRQHYATMRDAIRFLVNAAPATKLQRHRRQIQRRLRALLAAYEAGAPRPTGP